MVEFINAYTGTSMFVADNRKEEYIAAGHKLVAIPSEPVKTEEPVKKPIKKIVKKK